MVFSLAMGVLILASCTANKAEQEIADIDTFIEEVSHETITNSITVDSGGVGREFSIEPITKHDNPETTEETAQAAEDLAEFVINNGINGDERKAYLGERYEEIQRYIDTNYEPPTYEYSYPSGDVLNAYDGINYYNGILETYYNMDMSGVVDWMHTLGFDGDYWVRSDGVKMLGNYVMVAADYDWMPKGSIVETSLGTGIVCDTGLGGWYWVDIAVEW